MLPLVLSSDSHVFEPPDLWQTRIDAAFRDRAPRIERIDGADQIVVEADRNASRAGMTKRSFRACKSRPHDGARATRTLAQA